MPLIVERRLLTDDPWVRVAGEEALPRADYLLLDLGRLQQEGEALAARGFHLGVRLEVTDAPEALKPFLDRLELVAMDFPSFADGRGFSQARILRDHLGFRGQLRALGEVTWDRLRYMARCGFDAFEIPDERFDPAMLSAFEEINVCYQGASDGSRPRYRQAAAAESSAKGEVLS